ncbi:MAG: GGDEF domain-containing protein [Bacilli bacterium]|nr:GGDEF domain-containing protein [Bacilli bacterium]
MSLKADKKHYYKTIDKTCLTANTIYLVLHIFYLVLFIISGLTVLSIVTGAIIAFYLFSYWLIKIKKYYLYALICGNVFFGFITVTSLMAGFNTGFHFYLIGLCIVSFFTSYFSKSKDIKGSIVWVGLSLAIYLTLYLVSKFNEPYYRIENWLEITLFTTNAVVLFGFIASYMVVFLKYALSLEKKIMNESRTDELTQIKNRYGLYDYFEMMEDKSNKVLALFDIDDFKAVNDRYGHAGGDYVLKRIAEIATKELSDCFVCRYGGEEFVIVFEENDNVSVLERLEALRKKIENEKFGFEGDDIQITITIGAAKNLGDLSLERWVEEADEKMYSGKKSGKNKTVM